MRFVRTTTTLVFEVEGEPSSVGYGCTGWLCRLVSEDKYRGLLIPVKHLTWYTNVGHENYTEVNAMEFLAEVHAGNVPDEALKELP